MEKLNTSAIEKFYLLQVQDNIKYWIKKYDEQFINNNAEMSRQK